MAIGLQNPTSENFYQTNYSTQIPPFISGKLGTPYMEIEDTRKSLRYVMAYAGRETAVWTDRNLRIDTKNRRRVNPLISATAGAGAGAAVTITIAAADLLAGQAQFNINDLVDIYNATGTPLQGKVTSTPAANQIVVTPTDATVDIGVVIVAGTTRIVFTGRNQWPEGSAQPRFGTVGVTSSSYNLQIIKGGIAQTGTYFTSSVTWYNAAGAVTTTPGTGVSWSSTTVDDAYMTYCDNMNTSHLMTNPVMTNITGELAMTGMFYIGRTAGRLYSVPGGWGNFSTAASKQYMDLQLQTNTGVKKFIGFIDTSSTWSINEAFGNQAGALQMYAGSLGNLKMDAMLGFGFDGVKVGDSMLAWKALTEFDNNDGLGLHEKGNMYIVPEGTTQTLGGTAPFWEMTYLAGNGENRSEQSWARGGAVGGDTKLEIDEYQMFWRGHRGNVFRQVQNFGRITG